MITLIKLLQIDYEDKKVANILLFLLAFPTAFFFIATYSESLFLFLTTLSLYYARKNRWFLSAITTMLLAVIRLPGILLVFVLIYEYEVSKLGLKEVIKSTFGIKKILVPFTLFFINLKHFYCLLITP